MKVYLPSWNGDFRLVSGEEGETCKLVLEKPTPFERKLVGLFLHEAGKKKWATPHPASPYDGSGTEFAINAPIAKASKVLIKITRPKKQTLTAVSFGDGKLSVVEGTGEESLEKVEKSIARAAKEETAEKQAAAASVKRPTPCCPTCEVGAIGPASEVLLAFLNDEEHESWAKERAIVVTGGLTGKRYMLAHRNSPLAARNGKICRDLDDDIVIHFHDNSVPPEEEVLAAKLILEHREPWLRNEATVLAYGEQKFKNPFGDMMDGVESTSFSSSIGGILLGRFG